MSGDGCSQDCIKEEGFTCTNFIQQASSCSLIKYLAIERTLVELAGNEIKVQLFLNRKVQFTDFGDNDVFLTFRDLEEKDRDTKVAEKSAIQDSLIEITITPKKSLL